jgi:CheY-like chemotaxis protein
VAHDFNNLLTIISGGVGTLQRHLPPDRMGDNPARVSRALALIEQGAQRAATLTHRLLAFARRQTLAPKPLDANRLVTGMSELLRRTLGESIAIETVLSGGLWRIFADPNQLENALLNLAVNARDAMAGGGKLTIETANAWLDDAYAILNEGAAPGQYVLIPISDTGIGISKDIIEHVFEPFFTTKDVGHGTGLGLSQVYGFIKQSNGHIKVYSEPGQGTTVKLYLPRLLTGPEDAEEVTNLADIPRGDRADVVLVVEDDDDVRSHTTDVLRELGYRVLEAANGAAALALLARAPDVRLLFTDVGLPGGMTGRQLVEEVRRRWPKLKVLYTTGYARNAIVHGGVLDPGTELLPKPFTYSDLAAKIRAVLES